MNLKEFLDRHYAGNREFIEWRKKNPEMYNLCSLVEIKIEEATPPSEFTALRFYKELLKNRFINKKKYRELLRDLRKTKQPVLAVNLERKEVILFSFPKFEELLMVIERLFNA
jgi:hypothetical protein